jgi:alkanesulfonate monooxygenase SsuD/methylene tetrahydromethanopterin reductase-like flavin-dependent oxidoreductase (luciferase family)
VIDFGTFGIWTNYRHLGEENAGEAARLVEELGFGTLWLGGSPQLASVRPLLEASESLVVGTSIVNVWAYQPERLVTEYADLAADFGERLVVGIGIWPP